MKKTRFFAIMVMALVLLTALGCKTQQKQAETEAEKAFLEVYDQYRTLLILDGAEKYTVVSGDTLSNIARSKYNNGFYYPVIMLASNDVVLDPHQISPGMKLTIPDLDKNLNNPVTKANIKNYLNDIAKLEESRSPQDAQGLRDLANSL